ncbi:hypothetical protein R1flu_015667 [Riccia fluitans]|uniref:Uncharacterized protein n=1 Tax=Riccia fluitans TaxID=41844 RepID=A0ABD1YK32_9MARC
MIRFGVGKGIVDSAGIRVRQELASLRIASPCDFMISRAFGFRRLSLLHELVMTSRWISMGSSFQLARSTLGMGFRQHQIFRRFSMSATHALEWPFTLCLTRSGRTFPAHGTSTVSWVSLV